MSVVGWGNLQEDLLDLIFKKLRHAGDVIRCGAVCMSWNWVSSEGRRRPSKLLSPMLLFPPTTTTTENGFYKILDHSNNEFREFPFSEAMSRRGTCRSSCNGWLVFQDRGRPTKLTFVNPITRRQIQLPEFQEYGDIQKVVASSSPSDPNCMVMAIYQSNTRGLAFYKRGDERWKISTKTRAPPFYDDIVYYKDKFYALNWRGVLHRCEINDNDNLLSVVEIAEDSLYPGRHYKRYLVESSGDLLQITTKGGLKGYAVRKMDFETRKWMGIGVRGLGENALFLDKEHAFAVSTKDSCEFTADSIYFLDEQYRLVEPVAYISGRISVVVSKRETAETIFESFGPYHPNYKTFWFTPDL